MKIYKLHQHLFGKKLKPQTGFAQQTAILRCLASQSSSFKPSYHHFIGKEPLVYRNVGQSLDLAAEIYGSNEAIVSCHENERYTFADLRKTVDRVAAGFLKLGLQKGDPVGIWAPNTIRWYLTMMGAARAGLASVGINPAYQGPEVEYCLRKVGIRAIVASETFKSQKFYEILKSICPELSSSELGNIRSERVPMLKSVIIDSSTHLPGAMSFDDVLGLANSDEINRISAMQQSISPDSPCNIQFTSGTTGQPKAAVLSHFNFVNNGIHIGKRNEISNERICVQVPLFHAFGVAISIMAGLTHGAALVLPAAGFVPEASLRAIVNEKCSVIHGTPTMYVDLLRKQNELNLPLKTAKIAITGGAPCSPKLFHDIKNILGLEQVKTVFGLTESTAVIFQSKPGDSEEKILNTVGHLQDHIEAKVIDANGNSVPFGEPGELCVRGYLTMLGYFDDKRKTEEAISSDKWLRTGDQFILQEDGYGRIVGRLKEMIIRGGENIFPKEIEDFLNTHPDVIETHVIGVEDERMGEEVCAFVRLRDGAGGLSRADVKDFCKGRLAHFKVPRYVHVVKDFPKTTSGKIQKFKLTEMYERTNQSVPQTT